MDTKYSDTLKESTSVVIIGAGIAGLGAALTLKESNFDDYILVEAQSYIGGRIYSLPWKNSWLEQGAQFLHGTGSKLAKFAEERGLISDNHAAEGEGLYIKEDGTEVDHKLVMEVDDIIKNILEDCEKYALNNEIEYVNVEESIGKVLKARFYKYLKMLDDPLEVRIEKEQLFDWNIRFLTIDNACTILDELSVKNWGRFKAVSGPEHNVCESHYGSIVQSIVEELTQDNIRLNSAVKKIEWNDRITDETKPIVVTLEDDKKVFADCAIVTCSLGFLKENHSSLFSPALPRRLNCAIQSMGFGLINKIFLDFEEPWWDPQVKGFQFLWNLETDACNNSTAKSRLAPWTRDLTGFDVLKNHEAVLLGWIGRKGAQIIESLSEQQIIQDCAELFKYFLKNDNIPEASKCIKSCWTSNRFVKGGYSHITKNCDISGILPSTLAEPIWGTIVSNEISKRFPILMLAGEATHESHYSTTHGAYETGIKQAQTFLQHYNAK